MQTITFEQWKKTLDDEQIDFILNDYFSTHPDVENGEMKGESQ